MYVVEVSREEDFLSSTLDHVKNWLNLQCIEAQSIQVSLLTKAVVFRVTLRVESEAAAFASAFSGQVLETVGM
ncbi:MAG: hypothetical protein JO162_05085 [Alphaproteobacteria bacterium]|nr:hypothetical protein [Alphaproteobacteria bacterium]